MKKLTLIMLCVLSLVISSCKAETKKEVAMAGDPVSAATVKKQAIRVALLLDTSNSMDGLIDQAKAQLWEIVNELSYAKCKGERPQLEIALYEYGNDRLAERDGYLRKILAFTNDLDDVSKELFSLTTNGGSEYCGAVIQASLDNLNWGNDADDLKMIFIAGNEPFTQGKVNFKEAASNAKKKDVVINTIFCGKHEQGIDSHWRDGAKLTYGDYMSINHNQETVHIASPYDDIILQLNVRLNKTYVPYGEYGRKKIRVQVEQDDNAAEYSKANAVSRTVSKGSHLYKNSSWDLVDAEEKEDFSYKSLKKNQLPEALRGKSEAELRSYLEDLRKERDEIQAEISRLNEQRRAYIATKKGENSANGLEAAMITSLKKQAAKKNYVWQ